MIDSPFLDRIKTNKKTKDQLDNFKKHQLKEYREFIKEDSFKTGVLVVYFETKGKGDREVLQQIHHCGADVGKIGESWGEIYLYNRDIRLPRKFKVKSHRILIRK